MKYELAMDIVNLMIELNSFFYFFIIICSFIIQCEMLEKAM